MTKYILFSFGEVSVKNTEKILNIVGKISTLKTILYQSGASHLNIQFNSSLNPDELKTYFKDSLLGLTESHHLSISDNMSEKNDRMMEFLSVIFDFDTKDQSLTDVMGKIIKERWDNSELGKLDKENYKERVELLKSFGENVDSEDEIKSEDISFVEKLDSVICDFISKNKGQEEYIENIEPTSLVENEDIEYNVDNILDKINEKGLSSLTQNELNFLNSLSK